MGQGQTHNSERRPAQSEMAGLRPAAGLQRFSNRRHIVSVLRERPMHSCGVKRNNDALEQWDWNRGAGALQGMSHPSILAKQDRLETDIEREDSWAPPY